MDSSSKSGGSTGPLATPACTSDYPELHVVFDFFADNPQKVMPPHHPDVTGIGGGPGGHRKDNPFYDPYWESIRVMQESEMFIEGMLLKSVDCKRECRYLICYIA